jgi:hypothetical protein
VRREIAAGGGPVPFLLLVSALLFPPAASAQIMPEELLVRGLSWDLQIEGGAGFGLDARLPDIVVGRLRVGALLANEPLIYNLGITGELGGLASRGAGAELEVNHFGGPWLRVGICYVRGDDWMTRASLGFAIFSLEWQHRLASWEPRNALMFQLRLPIGIYCFLSRKLESQKLKPHDKTGAEVGAGELELP